MKDLSFRARLLLYIIPCVVVGLLAVGTIAYEQFTSVIETELSSSMFKTSEVTATNINTWLQGRLLETEVSAANSQAKAVNSNWSITDAMDAERFTYLHKTHKEYEDIYAADQKAEFHTILAVNPDKSLKMNIGNLKGRSYYESIMAGGPPHFSEPLISRTTNLATTFAVAPIHDEQGRPIGLVGSGITLKYIEDQVNSMKYGEKGFGLLIASDGLYIVHPDQSLVMKEKITDSNDASVRELGRQMLEKKSGIYQYQKNGEKYIAFYHPIPAANWTIAAVVAEAELFAPAAKLLKILAPIILLIIIIMVAIILYAAKKLVAPLKELSIFADQVATGDLTGSLELSSKDEIGMLAASLNKTVASLRGIVGDLTNASHDIGSFSGKLSDVTAESGRASESIAQTMQDVAQGAVKQAQDAGTATELARHLSETSVTVRNSCSSMAEQAEQSKRASDTGTAAVMEAVKSMELIASHNKQHVQDTNDLLKKSQEIGQIIGVITGIAEQTNLLALNAAIEAARAGEHGRGFAVVAEEVRKLAEQSAKAADQITQLINGVQNQVQTITTSIDNGSTQIARGVDIAKHAGENFKEIKSVFDIISTSVLDMTKAVENMASGVNQVLDAIQNVAAVTEETSASTEEVSAAAEQQTATMQQIASSARKLFEQAEKLNKIVENFKL